MISGLLRHVPDHWPSDYEVKLRIMADELQNYKQSHGQQRVMTTHLMSRVQVQDTIPDIAVEE